MIDPVLVNYNSPVPMTSVECPSAPKQKKVKTNNLRLDMPLSELGSLEEFNPPLQLINWFLELSTKNKRTTMKKLNSIKTKERLSWDEYFSEIVQVTAKRSPCERLNVGCILVKNNRIISQGYNGYLSGCPHKSIVRNEHEQATVHAEQNAIADCAKRGVNCENSTAYITHYPCIICTRLMLSSGVKVIKYINDYKNDELVNTFVGQLEVPIIKLV
jgi:dCMP deaminase